MGSFDEEWLVDKITSRLNTKTKLNDIGVEASYQMLKWMLKNYWQNIERVYNDIKMNRDSFIVTCRTAYVNNIQPFQFDKTNTPIYKKLDSIATDYRDTNKLQEFYGYLQEGQYYINIWTAYFLLDKFSFRRADKLIGLNDDETIFDFCYHLIENTFQNFKDKKQIKNCSYWLEEKRRTT